MRLLIIFFATIFFSFSGICQEQFLKGKITDQSTKEAIPFVTIQDENGKGVQTDFNGNYKFPLAVGKHKISFKSPSHKEIIKDVEIKKGEDLVLNIQLEEFIAELEGIVVSSGKFEQKLEDITVTMVVVKPDLIENKSTTNAETIVEQVPGVTVQDGQVSIRGGAGYAYGAGSRVILVLDDMPFLAADAGDIKWNALPLENISQMEVMKGASSVLFGSSALNGVINIRTKSPGLTPETKINVYNGIYMSPKRASLKWWNGTQNYIGTNFYHGRQIKKNTDLVIGGNFLSDQGYRAGEFEDRGRLNFKLGHRDQKVKGLMYGLNGNFSFAKNGLYILWESDSLGYNPSGGSDPLIDTSSTISINDAWRINLDPYISFITNNGVRHSLNTRWYQTRNKNLDNRNSVADLYYSEYQFQKSWDSTGMVSTNGIVFNKTNVASQFFGDHQATNFAFFSQIDKKIGRFNLNLGIRGEYFKLDTVTTKGEFLGATNLPVQPVVRSGMTYKAAEYTILRASFGQGFRFPSIGEKFASTNVGAVNIFPNTDLNPERGWSAEIGVKQGVKIGKWKGMVDIAGFWSEYKDMIEFAFDEFFPDNFVPSSQEVVLQYVGFQARNTENARITGLDASIMGTGQITKDVKMTLFAGYTYMNPITLNNDSTYKATSTDTSGVLKFRYRHLIKSDIQLDYKKWSFGLSTRYNSFMENIDKTFEELEVDLGFILNLGDYVLPGLPDYRDKNNKGDLIFDARLSYEINKNSKLAFLCNNLMNREVMGRPGDLQPPRTFITQLTLNF